jgi:hypothetical protein
LVFDGKVYPQKIEDIEGEDDFTLVVVTSKADIEAWEAYNKAGGVEACNMVTKADIEAYKRYIKTNGL